MCVLVAPRRAAADALDFDWRRDERSNVLNLDGNAAGQASYGRMTGRMVVLLEQLTTLDQLTATGTQEHRVLVQAGKGKACSRKAHWALG
jgi:hypothetical protein